MHKDIFVMKICKLKLSFIINFYLYLCFIFALRSNFFEPYESCKIKCIYNIFEAFNYKILDIVFIYTYNCNKY